MRSAAVLSAKDISHVKDIMIWASLVTEVRAVNFSQAWTGSGQKIPHSAEPILWGSHSNQIADTTAGKRSKC